MKRSLILMTLLVIPWLMICPALAQTQTQTAAPEPAVAAPDKAPATATGKTDSG
ncbi:MAG: hypothetical protein MZV70_48360 [Desulfobacterales bacterium]|nr:hypothetical protein [Desulfobacterales bacterium]